MADIMMAKDAATKWGVTTRRVNELIRNGRIKSAYKIGSTWVMPANTQKPADERLTTGKYAGIKRTKKKKRNKANSNKANTNNSLLIAQYMPRPRVDEIFDQATRCKLVYVTAGAGYGKTLAASHYIEQQPDAAVRWMQLTESDNIGSNYWEHLTHNISFGNSDLAAKLREFGFPDTLARFKQFVGILKTVEHSSLKKFLVFDI